MCQGLAISLRLDAAETIPPPPLVACTLSHCPQRGGGKQGAAQPFVGRTHLVGLWQVSTELPPGIFGCD